MSVGSYPVFDLIQAAYCLLCTQGVADGRRVHQLAATLSSADENESGFTIVGYASEDRPNGCVGESVVIKSKGSDGCVLGGPV